MSAIYRGKEIFKPLNTGWIDGHAAYVREYVANVFFYTKNGVTIMIDAGYNYPRLKEKMGWIGVDPESIRNILITHQDTDHVGAVEEDSDGLFRNAVLYIGDVENRYLTGEARRKVCYGLYTLPKVTIENRKILVQDGQVFSIEGIKVECFLVPGHTWGHMVYLIDDSYLFTGDTIWLGADGGKSFINMLAESNPVSIKSLKSLENKLRTRDLPLKIITGHTGWTDDIDFAFAHTDEVCNAWVRQKPHDPTAPYDGYDERDDTEEGTKSNLLPKADRPGWNKPDYANWIPDVMIPGMTAGTAAAAAGFIPVRIAATDMRWPEPAAIDAFLAFYDELPPDAWLHFHCQAGMGRTTTFLVLTELLRHPEVALSDALSHQLAAGGADLHLRPEIMTGIWLFAQYARERRAGAPRWSEWLARHDG